jgi:hypothetical protein
MIGPARPDLDRLLWSPDGSAPGSAINLGNMCGAETAVVENQGGGRAISTALRTSPAELPRTQEAHVAGPYKLDRQQTRYHVSCTPDPQQHQGRCYQPDEPGQKS